MTDDELRQLIQGSMVVAVVGASTDERKPSHQIPKILRERGFTMIPIHPKATEILGQKAYPTLSDVPVAIDIVDVFRPADEAPDIAEQAAAIGARALWLQLGITSPQARAIAEAADLRYVEDRCIGETVNRLDLHAPG